MVESFQMDIQRLLRHIHSTYYIEPVMFIVELFTLILGVIYITKSKVGLFFVLYIAFDFLVLIIFWTLLISPNITSSLKSNILSVCNTLISLVELLAYYYFFEAILVNKKIKTFIFIFRLLYLILIATYLITRFNFITDRLFYVSYSLSAFEFLILIPPCFSYYSQILKTNSSLKLLERPSFWIVTGIFFYSLISIPFYLLNPLIRDSKYDLQDLFGALLFELPLTIHFAFLSRAFLCKKPLTI